MIKLKSRLYFLISFYGFIIKNKTIKDINLFNYKSLGIGLSNTLLYKDKYIIKIRNRVREILNEKKYNGVYEGDFVYDTKNKFKREFEALNKLSKYNLSPKVIEYSDNYLIIEFLKDAITLSEYINQTNDIRILDKVIKKIEYLHSLEIFHGDLNFGNILVDKNQNILFIDFESLLKDELSNERKKELDFLIFEDKMKKFHPNIYKVYSEKIK